MGRRYTMTCDACGYQAEVSGGPDSGKLVTVQTMTCLTCRSLVDVVTEIHARGAWLDALDHELGRCPSCLGRRLEPWGATADDHASGSGGQAATNPCPLCGTRMRRGESTILWD
ncbi:MAG: hypothetical protein R3C15_02025 [Thermoleophilia bacterium]